MTRQLDLYGAADFMPAAFSPCRRYRYELRRETSPGSWGQGGSLALFCGANPSTADETENDPTIRREIGFARRWGCDGMIKVNLFGLRGTDPRTVPRTIASVGERNREAIALALHEPRVQVIVAAWGDCLGRGDVVQSEIDHFLRASKAAGHVVQCFGRTRSGAPRHPLMLANTAELEAYEA